MGSNTRDAIRWVIAVMIVLVPIASFAYSVVRYGAVAALVAFFAIVFVATMAYLLYTVVIGVKMTIDDVLEDDELGCL